MIIELLSPRFIETYGKRLFIETKNEGIVQAWQEDTQGNITLLAMTERQTEK